MIFSEFIEKVRSCGHDATTSTSRPTTTPPTSPPFPSSGTTSCRSRNTSIGQSLQNGFFWFGPAGTITPFHHDLTNNLMAQVIGRKRILLAPSWDMPLMRNLFHVYCEIDGRATPPDPRAELRRSRRSSSASSARVRSSSCPSAACTSSKCSRSRRPSPSPTSPSTTTTSRASTRPIKASEVIEDRRSSRLPPR